MEIANYKTREKEFLNMLDETIIKTLLTFLPHLQNCYLADIKTLGDFRRQCLSR